METLEFFKNLGIATLIVAFSGGFGYWTFTLINKVKPNLKYWFKYNVLRKKYNEDEVQILLDYSMADLSVDQVNKFLLLNGKFNKDKAKELCWIYTQIKMKGGTKNE